MTRLHERLRTDLPIEATFDFIADFANASSWDPGVDWSRRTEADDGPVGVDTTYELGVRMRGRVAPMTYRITHFERPGRVTLVGTGSGVESVDDIGFARSGGGTDVDYTADIKLVGWRRLLEPFLGGTFARIGREAAAGMAAALERLAASVGQGQGER